MSFISELAGAQLWFFGIAATATVALLIQTLMMLVGFDADADVDADVPDVDDGGLHLLSVRTITAFFVGFGWMGLIALRENPDDLMGAGLQATGVGAVFMFTVFFLMKWLWSLQSSGTLDYSNAVGETANVYLPVPADRAGAGQVEVMIQGRLVVAQALTDAHERLENQTRVKVVGLADRNTLVVEPA